MYVWVNIFTVSSPKAGGEGVGKEAGGGWGEGGGGRVVKVSIGSSEER